MEPTSETIDGPGATWNGREEQPLVVVLSGATAEYLAGLAEAGWGGPILIVGSVAEAREALQGNGAVSASGAPSAAVAHRSAPLQSARVSESPAVVPTGLAPVVDLGRLRLDDNQRRVINAPLAEPLTPLEFGVLKALLSQPGRVQRFAELTRSVWGIPYTGDCSQLHAVVRRLRGKLDLVRAPVDLAAVRGVGFRLAPQQARVKTRLGGALASI